MKRQWRPSAVIASVIVTMACTTTSAMHGIEGYGPKPALPEPDTSWIPVVNVVKAVGWSAGERPVAMTGTTVNAFATGLAHPRWPHVLPNGDVLVAETNAPSRPDDGKGIKGWFFKRYQKKAGGAVPSANRLAHSPSNRLPAALQEGMFVGQHGSWNRDPRAGYRVIFVPFSGGKPNGMPIEVLTGFVRENGEAMGRPVGVALDSRGGLLGADDVGNMLWRVSGASAMTRR